MFSIKSLIHSKSKGMELVQVAILIAIAIGIGLIFKERISDFINEIFDGLNANDFI